MNTFAAILQRLVERVPGATGAIFADWEGETIGCFAVDLPDLEIQIVGAQWGVVWAELQRSLERARLARPLELMVDGERGSVLVRQVSDQYYAVLTMTHGAHLATALQEFSRVIAELKAEM